MKVEDSLFITPRFLCKYLLSNHKGLSLSGGVTWESSLARIRGVGTKAKR